MASLILAAGNHDNQVIGWAFQAFGGFGLGLLVLIGKMLLGRVTSVLHKIDHLEDCLHAVKTKVEKLESVPEKIISLEKENAHLRGTLGVGLHEDVGKPA